MSGDRHGIGMPAMRRKPYPMEEIRTIRNYVAGEWREPDASGTLDVENPSTRAIIGRVPLSTAAEVDSAVTAAGRAFEGWSVTPVTRRVEPLFRLLRMLQENEETISRTLTEEMGKSLPDARAEMKRVYQNIEAACGAPILQNGESMIGTATGIDGETIMAPMGVFAAVTPFNFPAMAPFWFIPYAIAAGNTFVCKPSELTPLTMELLARFIDRAGFPPGVFNLVNGDKSAASALIEHPGVVGVSFVGKSDTCRIVAARCAENNKRCQAMGSAKNHLVVMPDYEHIGALIRNMSTSCYGCAGQRCMASSVIVGVSEEVYRRVSDRFIEESKSFIVADPLDPDMADEPMLMGPVISETAREFVYRMIESGVREGATLALDGRDPADLEDGYYVGPTVFTDVTPEMTIYKTEIFAPVVCILKVDTIDEAIGLVNAHPLSNACSIYTRGGYYARKFKLEARCGMIGINVGIPAPVPFLPFGGIDNSMHCDIKMQGKSAFRFFTHEKVVVERFWEE